MVTYMGIGFISCGSDDDNNYGCASQRESSDVTCGWESIESSQCEGQCEADGQRIKHPDVPKHHVVHHVFDAVCVECFIQSKETAEMAYGNNEMERCSES